MVVLPGSDGDFGVLAGHAPLISTIRPGVIEVYDGNAVSERLFVSGGMVEVTPEACTVLAEDAVNVKEIDRATAEQRLKDAREDVNLARDPPRVGEGRKSCSRGRSVGRGRELSRIHIGEPCKGRSIGPVLKGASLWWRPSSLLAGVDSVSLHPTVVWRCGCRVHGL